jgi:hypothetical protein
MTTKKTASHPPRGAAPHLPASRDPGSRGGEEGRAPQPARSFERQAPPLPRLQPVARDPHPADPAQDARQPDPPAAPSHRSARDVILRLVETLKEL